MKGVFFYPSIDPGARLIAVTCWDGYPPKGPQLNAWLPMCVCACVPGTGCVWIYSKKARWVEWERHSNSLHNTINMHYVTMHGQKQAAVPASNMVGKRSPHFTSGIQGKCLSGADTASKWKDCLHAYVCACGGGCVCASVWAGKSI